MRTSRNTWPRPKDESFYEYKGAGNTWVYTEFGGRRKSWDKFYRVIYTKPVADEFSQILFDFARPETIIYMAISFFLFEVFKKDVGTDIIPLTWYATTFRRYCLDVAGTIVRTGRQIVLQVTLATWDFLRLDILWERCVSAYSFSHVT